MPAPLFALSWKGISDGNVRPMLHYPRTLAKTRWNTASCAFVRILRVKTREVMFERRCLAASRDELSSNLMVFMAGVKAARERLTVDARAYHLYGCQPLV